jgi:hypothetical protein
LYWNVFSSIDLFIGSSKTNQQLSRQLQPSLSILNTGG